MSYPKVILKSGKERSLERFHRWVFSGAIKTIDAPVTDGDLVDVVSNQGTFLARGHVQNGSIAVRILTFNEESIDQEFWNKQLQQAYAAREVTVLRTAENTNAFRLVHGEGDGLPGLIIDVYDSVAVMQAHSIGMYLHREAIAQALMQIEGLNLQAVYDKSGHALNLEEFEADAGEGFIIGEVKNVVVKEYGQQFHIDFENGQKTGFFLDQRENRALLGRYTKGKRVLNMFAYTGGFSIYALANGAEKVDSVDLSEPAIELTNRNVQLNFGAEERHNSYAVEAFKYMKGIQGEYDLMVLDPPAFAKHPGAVKNALKGYRRLNQIGFEQVAKNGIVFTFSCSQAISKDDFRKAVFSAAAAANRNVRILHQLSQPADHPVNIFHPESEYLKGLVLFVE